MPYIKCISIRNSVAGCLKYISNPDKTEEQLFLTGLNCSENIAVAEKEFCLTYQHYSHKNFYAKPSENGKSPVKAFHIIQSFKSDECDPELAHKIGTEWVKTVFGKDFQAIVCTHTDRENIHNHICLCPYDLNGVKFNSNKRSLERIRKVSDEICQSYGIGEMQTLMSEENHSPVGVTYGEWRHKKNGTSWKEIIRKKIDLLIKNSDDLDDLLLKLQQDNYTVKRGKYISVKAPNQQRSVRLSTLGADYSEENLSKRIQEYLDSLPKAKNLSEIIAEIMEQFRYETRKFSFAQSVKNNTAILVNQLAVINSESITSISQVENKLTEVNKVIAETQTQLDELGKKKKSAEEIISAADRYFRKYGLFEKGKQYPKEKQRSDKALLAKYRIKSENDIVAFRKNIQEYSDKITDLQAQLGGIKKKEADYQSIIETYKNSSDSDYISRLVKEARERMSAQENAKLKALQEEAFELYYPNGEINIPFQELKTKPNIDDYSKIGRGNWFDVDGENVAQKLENIYSANPLPIGSVILVKAHNCQKAFYVNDIGFMPLDGFNISRSGLIKQQEKQQTAVKKNSRSR